MRPVALALVLALYLVPPTSAEELVRVVTVHPGTVVIVERHGAAIRVIFEVPPGSESGPEPGPPPAPPKPEPAPPPPDTEAARIAAHVRQALASLDATEQNQLARPLAEQVRTAIAGLQNGSICTGTDAADWLTISLPWEPRALVIVHQIAGLLRGTASPTEAADIATIIAAELDRTK